MQGSILIKWSIETILLFNSGRAEKHSLLRPATTGRETIRGRNIQQPIHPQSINRRSKKRRIAPKRININEIIEIPFQITLRHDPIRIQKRHRPPRLLAGTPLHLRQVLRDYIPVIHIPIIRQNKIGVGLHEVPKRPNPAAAQCIKNTQFSFRFLVERRGEHAEVSASGAFMAEKGLAGVEFKTPFGTVLRFVIRIEYWL